MLSRLATTGMLCVGLLLQPVSIYAQTKALKPGFNFFSKDQDVQLGREAAAQVDREMPIVNNPQLEQWLNDLAKPLISQPEAGDYPYTFKWVNDPNINAFALPGGPIYMNTGLLKHADNEGEVVGVLAHEISHVALRHGTNQASRANLFTIPAMIGSMALGNNGGMLSQLSQLGIGLGLNGVLMKYSRGAETQSDQLGSLLMHRAGYNPIDMANFFEKLEALAGNQSGVANWFSSHPNPGNRVQNVQKEIVTFDRREYTRNTGKFAQMKALAAKLPAPAKQAQPGQSAGQGSATATIPPTNGLEAPSSRTTAHRSTSYQVSYPQNWQVQKGQQGESVTIAPSYGQVQVGNGSALGYGAMFDVHTGDQSQHLEEIAAAIEKGVIQSNPGMQLTQEPMRLTVNNRRAVLYMLSGPGPYQGHDEVVVLAVVERGSNQAVSAIFVAPERDYSRFEPTFQQMLRSITVR